MFYFQDEVTHRLLDRLEDCTRSFSKALILGGAGAQIQAALEGNRAGITSITHVDTSPGMLERSRQLAEERKSVVVRHQHGGEQHNEKRQEVEYVLMDASKEELPVVHGEYDGTVLLFLFNNIIRRVCASVVYGGILCG